MVAVQDAPATADSIGSEMVPQFLFQSCRRVSGTATEEKVALEGAGEEQSDADDRRGSIKILYGRDGFSGYQSYI
ncbi:hypothetical protein EMCRGX_G014162 [Ephydatia muelleri]